MLNRKSVLPDWLFRPQRSPARAKNDTWINAPLNAELRYLVETFDAAEKLGNQNYAMLLAFSLGQRDLLATRAKPGVDSAEDLFWSWRKRIFQCRA